MCSTSLKPATLLPAPLQEKILLLICIALPHLALVSFLMPCPHTLLIQSVSEIRCETRACWTRALDAEYSDDEMMRRRAAWQQPTPRYRKGVLAKYAKLVSSASTGAVTDQE